MKRGHLNTTYELYIFVATPIKSQIITNKVNMSICQFSLWYVTYVKYIQPHVYKIMYIAWAVLFKWFQIYHSIEYLASKPLRVPTFITLVINPTKQNSIFRNAFCVITKTIFITKYLPIQITLTQRHTIIWLTSSDLVFMTCYSHKKLLFADVHNYLQILLT